MMNREATSGVWQSSRGAGRSRIVVDLNQTRGTAGGYVPPGGGDYVPPGGARRKRGGCLRWLGISLGVLLLITLAALAGLFVWWRGYQQSPVYSLALLADAAQRNDRQTFDELIDARSVTRAFLPQVRQHATGSTRELPPAVERQVDAAVERQLPNVEPVVREYLRTSIADAARQVGGEVPFPLLVLALRGAANDVRETGDDATLRLNLGGDLPTELSMRRRGERWQVVAVRDPRIAAALAERLPTALPNVESNLPPGARGLLRREAQRRSQPLVP